MNKLKELARTHGFLVYPLLLALFPLLSFYGSNAAEIKAGQFKLSTFVVFNLIVGLVSWIIALVITRNVRKASVLSAVILVIFFMFGRVHDALRETAIKTPFMTFGPTKILLVASLVLLAGTWLLLRKLSDEKLEKLNSVLLLVSSVMVGSALLTSVTASLSGPKDTNTQATNQPQAPTNNEVQNRPDVYYLLLDGYTREDMLKQLSNYDNSGFTGALRAKGFYVADQSTANYAHTHFSVPSTFNMKYLDYLVAQVGEESGDRTPLRELVQNHEAANTFKSLGYKYVQIGSQWGWTMKSPQADLEVKSKKEADSKILNIKLDEFALVYMQTTALKPWISTSIRGNLVARIMGAFERTEEVPAIKEPTFTFTHVISPHPPYLFDRNGLIPNQTPLELDNHGFSDRDKFVEQTMYVNQIVLNLVDKILAESEQPPIIVLASDHGSAGGLTPSDFVNIDPNNLKADAVRERLGILNAYYFPDQNYAKLYPHITPVNTFRVILSQYFGQNLELLPDRSYFSGNTPGNEYRLYDVTSLVNPAAAQ